MTWFKKVKTSFQRQSLAKKTNSEETQRKQKESPTLEPKTQIPKFCNETHTQQDIWKKKREDRRVSHYLDTEVTQALKKSCIKKEPSLH